VRAGTLSATTGTWTGAGNTYTYQWQRSADASSWTDIRGATLSSYTLGVADEGGWVRVVVTASNVEGANSQASNAAGPVQSDFPVNLLAPAVTGGSTRGDTLTATQGSWSGAGNTYAYQWQRDPGSGFVNIAGATSQTYMLAVADENARVRVMVTATNPDLTVSAVSAATGTVAWAPPINTAYPAVTGTAKRASTLTASQGTWSGVGNVYAYQWQRSADGVSWSSIAGATDTAYTLVAADVGQRVRVLVTATNPDRSTAVPSPATAVVQAAPPVNSAAPVVTGTALLGAQLSATTGDWSPVGASYAYQWQRDAGSGFADIPGATSASYTLVRADVGATLRVRVTASNVDGSGSAVSAATGAVVAPPVNTAAPAVPSGTAAQGETLTADRGTWDASDATYAYTWLRCGAGATSVTAGCAEIGTGATYTLAAADVGKTVAVRVTATNAGGSASAASPTTPNVQPLPLKSLTPPSIAGTAQVGKTLTAGPGTWSLPLNSVTYVWQRCAADGVTGCQTVGTAGTYVLTDADDAHTIVLVATATGSGQTATASSPALAISRTPVPQNTVAPSIGGSPARGVTLTAVAGTWTNSPTQFAYQWRRCDVGGGCQDIGGATSPSYTLTKDDEGEAIVVVVTAANGVGSGTATSARTGAVAAAPPVNTARPVIQGTVAQGATLTAAGFAWRAPADTTYSVSWERCDANGCRSIAGATGAQYTPLAADVGTTLVAVSTAANADGTVSARSDRSATVLPAAPRWASLPVLSSSAGHVGDVLTITPGVWTGPAVDTDTVQLMRCTNVCAARGDANVTSYTVASGDLGAILRVRETASNAGGDTVVWSARYVGPVLNASAAASVLENASVKLRNAKGVTLAVASRPRGATAASAKTRPAATVRRAAHVRGNLSAWACQAALGNAAPRCSKRVRLRKAATLRLPASVKGALRVVVIKR
jgi:hypothetical protein